MRLSLAGGGTDLEAYYSRRPGMVVSATLDKYFYVHISPTQEPDIQIASSDFRAFFRHRGSHAGDDRPIWDGDLALPRAVLRHFGVNHGYHLFLASEIPPGTGLGSSSAVAVALIKAISTLSGRLLGKATIAECACDIEINQLGAPIGKQDQFAAAFGGLNAISFTPDGVSVEPLAVTSDTRAALEARLLLFFTGSSRNAATILSEQRHATTHDPETLARLDRIRAHADVTRAALERGDIDRLGELLHASWQEKRRLAKGVTSDRIDRLYTVARQHGAAGGKITGAGGGGFLMLYCAETKQPRVSAALEAEGLYRMDFRFESGGARVLVNNLSGPALSTPRHHEAPPSLPRKVS